MVNLTSDSPEFTGEFVFFGDFLVTMDCFNVASNHGELFRQDVTGCHSLKLTTAFSPLKVDGWKVRSIRIGALSLFSGVNYVR